MANSRTVQIAPSLMCADPLALGEVLGVLEQGGVEWLHIDVMDGAYVPNFALGSDYCAMLARHTSIPMDVHLMVERPDRHLELFCGLPGARITIHPETVRQPVRTLERIRELGATPGMALDPSMTLDSVRHLLPLVDQILIMTVSPGYQGQKLLPFCVPKIAECRALLDELGSGADIEVDGNVSWENVPAMVAAGADVLVVGSSSLFDRGRVSAQSLSRLRVLVAESLR